VTKPSSPLSDFKYLSTFCAWAFSSNGPTNAL